MPNQGTKFSWNTCTVDRPRTVPQYSSSVSTLGFPNYSDTLMQSHQFTHASSNICHLMADSSQQSLPTSFASSYFPFLEFKCFYACPAVATDLLQRAFWLTCPARSYHASITITPVTASVKHPTY